MTNNKTFICIVAGLLIFLCGTYAFSQEPTITPPANVTAVDTPNDDGSSITVTWDAAPEDSGIVGYIILRNSDAGEFGVIAAQLNTEPTVYKDTKIIKGMEHAYIVRAVREEAYIYIVRAIYENTTFSEGFLFILTQIVDAIVGGETPYDSAQTAAVKATGQWFHTGKIQLFIAMIVLCAAILGSIYLSRNNQDVFVRRIPGLEAVDEAIGRATEMGRSILYVLGLGGVSGPATIASMTILGQVARRTADYETTLRVPCNDPIVLNVVREMVKASYLDEGRPDAYSEEDIFFLTDSQFAYAAGVDGMMLREKPAAIFLQGTFYAESLILAETGNSIGAIQIAGTDSEHQLPFLITACDYTLIGEELYAASAYLSKEPMQLGSLRGQDWGKVLIFLTIVFGVALELFGVNWITTFLQRVG